MEMCANGYWIGNYFVPYKQGEELPSITEEESEETNS